MIITDQTQQTTIADKATIADNPLKRMVGLLNRKSLYPGEALVITRCNSIHMFFMRFSIDVIFINRHNRVVGLVKNLKPNRLSPIFWDAQAAIELPIGVIDLAKVNIGDQIQTN